MGYHIVNIKNNEIEHKYVESKIEIAYVDNITEETIIYQGEKQWNPIRVGSESNYRNYSKDWYRAGIKAQELFKKQAKKEKLVLLTTEKDFLRLNKSQRKNIKFLKIKLKIKDKKNLKKILISIL